MRDVDVISDPAAATAALDPIRSRLPAELAEPASAAALAARVGLPRQKVNNHLRALEACGLVTAAGERQWGGLTERRLVASARSLWQPPYRYAVDTGETAATEWIVEAKAGGTCTVRVVHSWFADSDDWDGEYEGHAEGWVSFFKILRAYLEHFPGQESTLVPLAAQADGTSSAAFERLMQPLGVVPGSEGQRVHAASDAPELAGSVVEALDTPEGFSVILRLHEPAQAIVHAIGFPMGGPVHVSVRF